MKHAFKIIFVFLLVVTFKTQGVLAMVSADDVIKKLDLKPLPEEGGFYRETYRSDVFVRSQGSNDVSPERTASTAIYYLVTPTEFSALHRISSDEVFHFYGGDSVEMIQIDSKGQLSKIIMGSDFMNEQEVQVVVPRGNWQALKLREGGRWALLGTTVAPGFEFADFEVGHRDQLLERYPKLREEILKHSRN